jgi:hypothetical protein
LDNKDEKYWQKKSIQIKGSTGISIFFRIIRIKCVLVLSEAYISQAGFFRDGTAY